jgi:hypothetical protein
MTRGARGWRDSAGVQRLRARGRELFMSVQPKGSPAQRKDFLSPAAGADAALNEGHGPASPGPSARKAFFGLLLPAHAESLKGQGLRTLDYNLLARQVEDAFDTPLPTLADLPPPAGGQGPGAAATASKRAAFSAEEAARVGLVEEAAVDWDGTSTSTSVPSPNCAPRTWTSTACRRRSRWSPAAARRWPSTCSSASPTRCTWTGEWQKVRLSHVSPGRTFFVFTHGRRHKQTISLTPHAVKLCESGRLRAFENAYLLERATARARRQLGALGAPRPA